ncbi:DNA-processing protein DprA [Bacillus tuaregi]|uniref:DNA-processing protein DprA n=1 Tax=Bacillus tuaregi TaxID=1816695 RepID=UPI0008F82900|nr:DNA-processing protein DprA [Bacillus tuaregi]
MDTYWIWFSLLSYIGPVLQKRILKEFESPKDIYHASRAKLESIPKLNKRAVHSIINNRDLEVAKRILEKCDQKGIKLLSFSNHLYPTFAKSAKESPILLYYRGHLKEITHSIGVVGSRRCTAYGRKTAEEIGIHLASQGIPLISGFAKGIDSYTQSSCINHGGYTILFLAGGVDICYPREQEKLYHKTIENGGVFLSQYPPGTTPSPKQFLQRNALISAWSEELIVVEASQKSGALWTADFANKQGKTIYAVPHSIYSPEGKGCNLLLSQGAVPYLGVDGITLSHSVKPTFTPQLFQEEDFILNCLTECPTEISTLAKKLHTTESEVIDKLLLLELEAKVIIRGEMVSRY